jgi:class 3 adenylate cyclase
MNQESSPHVFVSYVREDSRVVERLCAELKSHGVAVWLDREKIRPGERWQIAIRRAIEEGAFFIACFSNAYANRGSSYMNVELTIAVEQLRYKPADRAWFIPILLEGGMVPDRPIGGGETLRDIQWVDLIEDWDGGLRRILNVLRPESPEPLPEPSPQESPTVVVLVTDLVGSTSVMHQVGDEGFRRIIPTISHILNGAVNEYGGQSIKFTGDGMLATFDLAPKALQCACAIQRAISGSQALRNLKIRIGLAAGPVVHEHGDIFGEVITLAVRICSLAEAGEILISESVRQLASAEEFELRERGLVALRGFPGRLSIYEVRP